MNMKKNTFRQRLSFGAAISAIALGAPGLALAQEPEETTSAEAAQTQGVERIVITGSRIARSSNLETPNPITIVSGEDLLNSGQTDIAAVLRDIPALFSTQPANLSSRNNNPAGTSLLNLRALGTNRTLVLINGRRSVSGVAGSAAVDISTIPAALIERVDVSTGGASAVYGADGVSGVVNFILREDFDGTDYRAQVSFPEAGGGEEATLSLTAGRNFSDGRGNAVVSFEATQVSPVDASQRSGFAGRAQRIQIANSPEVAAAFGLDPNASNVFVPNVTLPVSSPASVIWLRDANQIVSDGFVDFFFLGNTTVGSQAFPSAQIVDGTGTLRAYNPGDIFVDPFTAVGGDGIATIPDVVRLQPNLERYNFNTNFRFDFSERVRFITEARYTMATTQEQNQVNGFNDDIPIALDNPYIPAALRAQINALIAEGITPDIALSRDNLDVPARTDIKQESFRIVSGLEGRIAGNWDYRVTYNYGRTDRTFDNVNLRLDDRFFAATDAVVDPATGNIVCRSEFDPNAPRPTSPFPASRPGYITFTPGDGQCAPLNLFGRGLTSPEAEAFIYQPAIDRSEIRQQVYSAVITGDTDGFFTLPAGPIGIAVGTEYREERSTFQPNGFELAGLSFRSLETASAPVDGRFDVWEAFGEVSVPILRDMPFAEELTLDGAVRYADYSTSGENTTWSLGAGWAPVEDIRLRATYGEAVRAPNINELFSPPQPTAIGVTQDPCNQNLINAGSEFRPDNCLQLVGPNFNAADFVSAQIFGRAGGNPNLIPETATTLTVGAVFTPRFLSGFAATVDYYEVDIENAISSIPGIVVIQNCVDAPSLDNDFCPLVQRDPTTGVITFFESGQQNVARFTAKGVDFDARYSFELADMGLNDWGGLAIGVSGSKNLERRDFQFQDFPEDFVDLVGEFGVPEWVVNLNASWDFRSLRLAWRSSYQSSQLLPGVRNQDIENDPNFVDPMSTGSAWAHYFNGQYEVRPDVFINFGVNNVTDRDPFVGTVVRPVSYLGRTYFLGVNGRF
jgi:iron complex outermembrane receptor protein